MVELTERSVVVIDDDGAMIDDVLIKIPSVTIQELIGSGANGIVFGGFDHLGRSVAIKVWIANAGKSRTLLETQEQALLEARKVAELKHENLVTIYSADRLENGWPYVVMERAPGVPLKELRDRLGTSTDLRRLIVGRVLTTLKFVEEVGVLHGDLHDGNVIVESLNVKVIDFGTSLFAGREASEVRHAKLVREFVYRTLPEFRDWFAPLPQLLQLTGPHLVPVLFQAFSTFLMLQKPEVVIHISNMPDLGKTSWPPDPAILGGFLARVPYFDFHLLFKRLRAVYSAGELDQVRAYMLLMLEIGSDPDVVIAVEDRAQVAERIRVALEAKGLHQSWDWLSH